jgi:hypothetical protein
MCQELRRICAESEAEVYFFRCEGRKAKMMSSVMATLVDNKLEFYPKATLMMVSRKSARGYEANTDDLHCLSKVIRVILSCLITSSTSARMRTVRSCREHINGSRYRLYLRALDRVFVSFVAKIICETKTSNRSQELFICLAGVEIRATQ